jgi:hypothetical protein
VNLPVRHAPQPAYNHGWLLVAPTAALFRYQNTKYKIFVNYFHDLLNVVKKINRIT